VSGDGLIRKVKEILNDAKVKRVVIKDDQGKVLLSIPVTWGSASPAEQTLEEYFLEYGP
jgi:hypothetical protein